ncbi:Lrp/AsnC family leucine-responsive transcriptional regulator [Mucilaginibacter gracilis]|uniref:Lrp/AsnC family leucine-responsive transcriptional regulator n=1 Tax=Mucilaginibacter gracilis TaxID=423350 RepID=A0A495J0E1_9SPHI|nr:Lrp/AsnC family transcriptional regulator [Mucilaginibacter gracilis]RKR82091.1 Lrp/AsnC family leucine-responsive transcriptional regulator [Mucilaginibacter gracilis]
MATLDPTDIKILNFIQQDARITDRQLAARVFKSAPTVHERLTRLENKGYIKKYITLLDREKIGIPVMAETHVKLERQSKAAIEAFEQKILAVSHVQFCCHLAGKWDFVIFIAVKDPQAYNDWLMNELTNWPNVQNIESSFVLKEIKTYGAFEL